jgi:hypothetical protein
LRRVRKGRFDDEKQGKGRKKALSEGEFHENKD